MNFALKTAIKTLDSFADFVSEYNIGEKDCILTNEYVLMPHLKGEQPPCFTVFQEKYGMGEPNDDMIDGIINEIGDREIDRVIAIGGGTILDIAKLLVFGKGYSCEELFTRGKDLPKVRSLIAVPTTCGTGSEVTGISIAEIRSLHTKLGLATPQAIYKWQQGLALPTVDNLVALAAILNCTLEDILIFVSPDRE